MINSHPFFSIIVPIFNTERYLKKCISSVLKQTFSDFELLLVNDGSLDNSLSICQIFQEKDNRIRLINKNNEGVMKARLDGIYQSSGQYLLFLDSDDWLDHKLLDHLYNIYLSNPSIDIICYSLTRFIDRYGLLHRKEFLPETGLLSRDVFIHRYFINSFLGRTGRFPVYLWDKCYSRKLFLNSDFKDDKIRHGEDLLWNMYIIPQIESIYLSNYPGYFYRYGGITSRFYPNYLTDHKIIYSKGLEIIDRYHLYEGSSYLRDKLAYNLFYYILSWIEHAPSKDKLEIIQFISKELKDPIWDEIINHINPETTSRYHSALKNRNSEEIYNFSYHEYTLRRNRNYIKKILYKLLQ